MRDLRVKVPSVRMEVRKLSGGQRQGVAIARAVHGGSEILLMDEPMAALGLQEQHRVQDLIADLAGRGLTLVIVSHNLDHVFALSTRIAVMRLGRLVGLRDDRRVRAGRDPPPHLRHHRGRAWLRRPPPSPVAGADARVDPLTGALVHVVGARQGRPNQPDASCPFCPGGVEAPDPYEVRWFVNRWPAMPQERCEVVLYTPEHDATFHSIGAAGARRVVDLWAERTAALAERDDVAYVLAFENRGVDVGATIAHPHGQIYAFEDVPPVPAAEAEMADAEHGDPLAAPFDPELRGVRGR